MGFASQGRDENRPRPPRPSCAGPPRPVLLELFGSLLEVSYCYRPLHATVPGRARQNTTGSSR